MKLIVGNCNNPTGKTLAGFYSAYTKISVLTNYTAMGWQHNDKIVGIALFDNYTGNNIDIHIWAEKGVTRSMITAVYDYAFNQLQCLRMSGKIASDNKKLLQLLPRFGFEYECTLRDYLGTRSAPLDVHVHKISAERALKWIRK